MKNVLLFLIATIFLTTILNGQSVVINELMASNNSIQDEDGEFSDWIELYNASNTTIDLLNYGLSDDFNDLGKWTFPNVRLLPDSYMLIFASKKNRLDTTELHTNFKISSSGEELFLTDRSGFVIDRTSSIFLKENESYSRVPDGSLNWIVTSVSSPGTTNEHSNQLIFSDQEGFYQTSFLLSINSLSGDTVFYTLNGDKPTENSNFLLAPLLIKDRGNEINIISEIPTSPAQNRISYKAWESPRELLDKATILRCASFRNGLRTSKIYTKSYFVNKKINDKYSMPVISLITEEKNLFDRDTGIYVPGVKYDSSNPEWTGNYFMQHEDWERNIHIEYFEPNGDLGFSQDAGVRIHGGKTRQAAQKSLRLYARKEYGEQFFNYKLLPQRKVDKYKRFLLRTTMGAWGHQTIIKDALAQNISAKLNIDYQEFQPVIVFVNGEYWGIHTIRDRIDERYIEYTHNIDKDSVEFRKWGNVEYGSLIQFVENNSLEHSNNYDYVKTQMDIDNYIDYSIAELFFKNYDWPANNVKIWRRIPDGKWRWILYDIDAGFGNVGYNMLLHATKNDRTISWPNSPSSTFLFRNLLKNNSFRASFIDRYAELLNNDFTTEIMIKKLDSIKAVYSAEIPSHIERWSFPNTYVGWEQDIENDLLYFIQNRPCVVRENIMLFFGLQSFDFTCDSYVNDSTRSDKFILAPNPNKGHFFLSNFHSDILDATITVTNMNGHVVYIEKDVSINKNERKYFDLSSLTNDIYVLQIRSTNFSKEIKIAITY